MWIILSIPLFPKEGLEEITEKWERALEAMVLNLI